MPGKAGLPGWFPEDFQADPVLLEAMGHKPAATDLAGESVSDQVDLILGIHHQPEPPEQDEEERGEEKNSP